MKGQITAFIIIGIVIVMAVAIAILIMKNMQQAPTIAVQQEKTGLRACLEDATLAAIDTIALRGGTYAATSEYAVLPPNSAVIRMAIRYDANDVYKQGLNFEPLCLLQGPNAPLLHSCMAGTYQLSQPKEEVIQYGLQQAVMANAAHCGIGGDITVTLGIDDVSIISKNVSVNVPIRLKRIYNLAYMVAAKDMNDPLFDKRHITSIKGCPETDLECVQPGLSIGTYNTASLSIVQIIDNKNKIKGKPFVFQYAEEQRPIVIGNPTVTDATATVTVADPNERSITISCPGATCTSPIDGIGEVIVTLPSTACGPAQTITLKARAGTELAVQKDLFFNNLAACPTP